MKENLKLSEEEDDEEFAREVDALELDI